MTTDTAIRLRPMTDAEREAVDMHDDGRTMDEILAATGLGRGQVAAAIELRDRFEKIKPQETKAASPNAAAAPSDEVLPPRRHPQPDPVWLATLAEDAPAVPDERPEIVIEPEPVDWDEQLPDTPGEGLVPAAPEPVATPEPVAAVDGLQALLEEAERSPQPRAKQLAAQIWDSAAELRRLLDNDEQVRKLTAMREVLRKHLEQTDAELAALLDAGAVAVPTEAAEPDQPAPAPAPTSPVVRQWSLADAERLATSPVVREWGRSKGWDVGTRGRIAGAVVQAYMKANPKGGGER